MKVDVYQWIDDYDYSCNQAMYIDGKRVLAVYPLHECPEDARIGRDLVSCRDVAGFMERVVASVLLGEIFEYNFIECKCDPDEVEPEMLERI